MKKKFDVTATVGKYTDPQGEEKNRYQKCGAMFAEKQDDGTVRYSIVMEAVPISPEWNGWFNCYESKPREGAKPAPKQRQQEPADIDW